MARFRKTGIKKARKKAFRMMKTTEHITLSKSSEEIIDKCLRYFVKYYELLTDEQLEEIFSEEEKKS